MRKKTQFALILYTKSHFGAIFGPTCMYKKLRNFRTVHRASQIWCQNVRGTRKKKVIKCRGESFARCRVIARNVEGGLKGPPPPVFLGLMFSNNDIKPIVIYSVDSSVEVWNKKDFLKLFRYLVDHGLLNEIFDSLPLALVVVDLPSVSWSFSPSSCDDKGLVTVSVCFRFGFGATTGLGGFVGALSICTRGACDTGRLTSESDMGTGLLS